MTEAEPQAGERIVEVSPEALSQIFPESGHAAPGSAPSRTRRWGTATRVRLRLLWTRVRFRTDDFQGLRCGWAALRLRLRLIWMRVRHRGRLPR